MAIVLSASAKSARPVILPGLPFGTAICSVLDTKSTGAPAPPASVTVFMVAGLAAAKTSAGAPALIWVARVALDPKLKVTVLPERGLEVGADLGERLGQRGGREHGERRRGGGLLAAPGRGLGGLGATGADQQQGGRDDQGATDRGTGGHGVSGISTTTWVDFTEATASTPGSSCRSSAASADISDTTRNGPHCRST